MAEIKNYYLDLTGLQQYDQLIKEYINGKDLAIKGNLVVGTDYETIKALSDAIKELEKIDHSHTNQTVLDGITAEKVAAWDAAEANVQADWNETDENSDAYIRNKPENLVQDANYVHTDNNYTTTEKTKLGGIEEGAEVNVIEAISVNGVDATITDKKATVTIPEATKDASGVMSAADKTKLDGIATGAEVNVIEIVKVNGIALTPDSDKAVDVVVPVLGVSDETVNGLKLELDDKENIKLVDNGLAETLTGKNVTVRKKEGTKDDQCVYEILQGETVVGTINHPKDMVVTGGEIIIATEEEEDLIIGEKYLKLTIANQTAPVYIAVTDLVDVYTAGNGIEISETNEISVKLALLKAGTKDIVSLNLTQDGLSATLTGWDDVKSKVDALGTTYAPLTHTHSIDDITDFAPIGSETIAGLFSTQSAQ